MNRGKAFCLNAALVAASLIFSFVLVELILRFAYPRYEYAADADYQESALRIWKRAPYELKERRHPDTGSKHMVEHNNLALRHARDISAAELAQRTTIGVFGDSFTENVRLPAAHGFVEVLDYLLNLGSDRFTVLNFGVDGYGTDQEYLYYQEWSRTRPLDHVLYVLCANDLGDLLDNNLFSLNESGNLERNPVAAVSPWLKIASRFHTTYLLFDVFLRIKGVDEPAAQRLVRRQNNSMRKMQRIRHEEEIPRLVHDLEDQLLPSQIKQLTTFERDVLDQSTLLFQSVLEAWRREVGKKGATFSVALLPREQESAFAAFVPDGYEVVNLYEAAKARMPDYEFEKIRFENDGHWNEEGNLIAALALYRFFEQKLGLEKRTDEELLRALYVYYKAVDGGWLPGERWAIETSYPESRAREIRRHYVLSDV